MKIHKILKTQIPRFQYKNFNSSPVFQKTLFEEVSNVHCIIWLFRFSAQSKRDFSTVAHNWRQKN